MTSEAVQYSPIYQTTLNILLSHLCPTAAINRIVHSERPTGVSLSCNVQTFVHSWQHAMLLLTYVALLAQIASIPLFPLCSHNLPASLSTVMTSTALRFSWWQCSRCEI